MVECCVSHCEGENLVIGPLNGERRAVSSAWRGRLWLWVVLALSLVGCQVTLISAYDPELDRAATALQKQMDGFLTRLERHAGLPESAYASHAVFYEDYAVELRSLHLRAQSHAQNAITAQQLTLMIENVRQLQIAHEAGPLAPPTLRATRDLLNQGWQAIIALEMAKRRGEALP